MISFFCTNKKQYRLSSNKYVCNRFGLAEALANHINEFYNAIPKKVLDVGCGAGPLSIYIADNYHCNVISTDISPLACTVCKENIRLLKLQQYIEVIQTDFRYFTDVYDQKEFDLIVSTPPVNECLSKKDIETMKNIDYSHLDDVSFMQITNSWCDEHGNDLSDYIFMYASSYLNDNGYVLLGFCEINCHSPEYIIKKAEKHGFCVTKFFSLFISPNSLGVEDFITKDITTFLVSFQKIV